MTSSSHNRKPLLRIPFRLQLLYGSRRFYTGFTVVMGVFFLFGPVVAKGADHNVYRYLLGPFACTLVALAIHLMLPYNPYRSRRGDVRDLYRLDERDEGARRLVEILGSKAHFQVTIRSAAMFAGVVFAAMLAFTIAFHSSLNWSLPSPWSYQGVAGGVLFAWTFIKVQTVSWALDTWREEAGEPEER